MSILPRVDRGERITNKVYDSLRQAIQSGALPAGSQVTISGLADDLGVSVTPVREALMILREAGLVTDDGAAIVIVKPSPEALEDALILREALEGMSARMAAMHRTASDLEGMSRSAQETVAGAEAGDPRRFRDADREFHQLIAAATGNDILRRYISNACDLAGALRDVYWVDKAYPMTSATDHIAIAEAIEAQDGDLAEQLMRKHIRSVLAMAQTFTR